MSSYSFTNLCGAPYGGGNICFTPDGNCLVAPVSNRIMVCDLVASKSQTLSVEGIYNHTHVALSPEARILLAIDVNGRGIIVNFANGCQLNSFKLPGRISDVQFSPNGNYVAFALKAKLHIFESPSIQNGWLLSKVSERTCHRQRINSIDWSPDGNFICASSKDMTVSVTMMEFASCCTRHANLESSILCDGRTMSDKVLSAILVEHRYPVRNAFFSQDQDRIFSVSSDRSIVSWEWQPNTSLITERKCGDVSNGTNNSTYKVDKNSRKRQRSGSPDKVVESNSCLCLRCGKWVFQRKAYCEHRSGKVSQCCFHRPSSLLVVGLTNGIFCLYECLTMDALYTLSLGGGTTGNILDGIGLTATSAVDSIAINNDGEWIALGSAELGQLIVWEWKSESFILKEQGHHFGVRCVAFSPPGGVNEFVVPKSGKKDINKVQQSSSFLGLSLRNIAATGGLDGKVKLWDTMSGFCFATFVEHSAPVVDICFTPTGNAVISASLDGSVRAFDRLRYRNFRTLTSPHAGIQFVCVSVDAAGDFVAAGCQGSDYSVLVWSLQTGSVMEILTGHQGPVVGVSFHPHASKGGILASASWDNSIRVWDIYSRKIVAEPLVHTSMVLSVAFDPRGNGRLASASMSGIITIWNSDDGTVLGTIEGIRDIRTGRRAGQRFSANNTRGKGRLDLGPNEGIFLNQHFTSISYATNGQWLFCASKQSPRIAVYDTQSLNLLHAFRLTQNGSLLGWKVELNSKYTVDGQTSRFLLDISDSEEEDIMPAGQGRHRREKAKALPGAESGEFALQKRINEFSVWHISVTIDGRQWAAATSHGLFIYSLDVMGGVSSGPLNSGGLASGGIFFDRFSPLMMTSKMTTTATLRLLNRKEFSKALRYALSLNDFPTILKVYENIPYNAIALVSQSIPLVLLPPFFNFLRVCIQHPSLSTACPLYASKSSALSTEVPKKFTVGRSSYGTPHLQHHLTWMLCTISSHLGQLQGVKPSDLTRAVRKVKGNRDEPPKRTNFDLRTLFLLLLREILRIRANLESLYASNIHKLNFLLQQQTLNSKLNVKG